MKKKKTLSTQLTFVISFIVLLIVGVFWMANNTLLEKYYVYNKEKEMLAVYKMVDLAAKNDKLSDDTFAVAFEKKCVGANQRAWIRFAVQPESVLSFEFYAADTDTAAVAVHYISFIVADTDNQVI